MKIGIYGDSYGDFKDGASGVPWPTMLANDFQLDVTSFCKSGSSLWYSYKTFLDTHTQFDKVVFLATGPGRLMLPLDEPYVQNDRIAHITNYDSLEFFVKTTYKNDLYMKKVAEAVQGYYTYIFDRHKEHAVHSLMYKEVKRIRPDALVIPCFYNIDDTEKYSLFDIHKIDIDHYKISEDYAIQNENRHCHMSQENNKILSELVKHWLDTGHFSLDPKLFVTSNKPVSYYFLQT